jgi:hypothetical protein
MGGVTEDDIHRISMTLPKFPVYIWGCHPQILAQISAFGFQGTVSKTNIRKIIFSFSCLKENISVSLRLSRFYVTLGLHNKKLSS